MKMAPKLTDARMIIMILGSSWTLEFDHDGAYEHENYEGPEK
jgi:hypothetical protein